MNKAVKITLVVLLLTATVFATGCINTGSGLTEEEREEREQERENAERDEDRNDNVNDIGEEIDEAI